MSGLAPFVVLGAVAMLAAGGCSEQEQIHSYRVKKRPHGSVAAPAKATDRMLGVIVPRGNRAWTFKLTGSLDDVKQAEPAVRDFLKNVTFQEPESDPSWTLPEKWEQLPGNQFRFATLRIGTLAPPLELSVAAVTWQPDQDTDFLLRNINRWRGQMGQPPLGEPALAATSETIEVAGGKATWVAIDGQFSGGMPGMGGGAPFASGPPPVEPGAVIAPPLGPGGPDSPLQAAPLKYDVPPEWQPAPADTFSLGAWQATAGDQKVRVTITRLTKHAGDWGANVTRWRGQLKLEPADTPKIDAETKAIEVGGASGKRIDLVGPEDVLPRQALTAVMVLHGDDAWFFRMGGDAELVDREQSRFQNFVKSVQFLGGSADDGN